MNSALERLLSLRVSDVMSRHITDVSPNQSMESAASVLRKHEISGAPVVDELGHCVGMLSAMDFVHKQSRAADDELLAGAQFELVEAGGDEPLQIDSAPDDLVSTHMSKVVYSIAPEATLLAAARQMCAQHVHRLPVVDAKGHVQGLVSSMDVVAALVQAMEE